ncbi:MAG: c-type cytochrome [Acidobacteria bacterium]|nr:c-type cytochrome [Acidobacteriota bacterium]
MRLLFLSSFLALAQVPYTTWRDYGGGAESAQFSGLKQVNRENVGKLRRVWSFPTGDNQRYFFNPLVIGNTMYVLARNNSLVALDAATGRDLWTAKPDPDVRVITTRGFNYWESADKRDRRLLLCVNQTLRAYNAANGEMIRTFGKNGMVDLKEGLDRDPAGLAIVQSMTPGRVFENLIILGSATNQGYGSAPGDIRAFDVRTGKLAWTFHTIPRPGEYGYDTWPKDAWKTVGGANVWGEMSLDEKHGILFAPTASAKYNFYGVDRSGSNLYSDSLLALDARTGTRLWHFQMVHHDIWDYDDATAPKLLTLHVDGKKIEAVAQVSKQGFVWVFNRVNGEPVWPIEERPVPQSDMPGEKTWPTQPFPTKPPPFARQKFTVDDLSPYLSPADRARFRDEILSARNEGLFTPPGRRPTIQMPGNNGGANWGGAAVDPTRGWLYVVSKDLPCLLKLESEEVLQARAGDSPEQRGQNLYVQQCLQCHGADRAGKPPVMPPLTDAPVRLTRQQIVNSIRNGQGPMPAYPKLTQQNMDDLLAYLFNPARAAAIVPTGAVSSIDRFYSGFGFMIASDGLAPIKPPWSTLTAYDLNKGDIVWQIPLGDVPALAKKGITNTGSHYPKLGPVATAGGLLFTGTRDKKVRALHSETGKVLWEAELDAAVEGIPAIYEVNGRQYIVFCAAAQAGLTPATQVKIPGAYVAFALENAN